MAEFVLEMRDITKRFPGVLALDKAQLALRPGEVHCLLGENGAGKSTMMKILAGAQQKDDGAILLEGQEIQIQSPYHAQQLGISMIYQEFNLSPYLSVAENIFLGREPRIGRTPFIDWRRMYADALSRHNLKPNMDDVYAKELETLPPKVAKETVNRHTYREVRRHDQPSIGVGEGSQDSRTARIRGGAHP